MAKKIVVITGASSGIGQDCVRKFAEGGFTVVPIAQYKEEGYKHFFDVSKASEVKAVFNSIIEEHEKIDVVINCAGFGVSGAVELVDINKIQKLMDVNFMGSVNVMQSALPYMKRGGKIFNLSSAMAFAPMPFRGVYAASKAAVSAISHTMYMELRSFGISVIDISPGRVNTPFSKNRIKEFNTNIKYGQRIENAAGKLSNRDSGRMPASAVTNVIYKQSLKKRNKPMIVINGKYKFLYFLTKITPLRWRLNFIDRKYGGY